MPRRTASSIPGRRRVALLIETSNAYGRGLLEGVVDHMREHETWSVFLPELRRGGAPRAPMRGWNADGVIARIETREIAALVARVRVPTVDVSAARLLPRLPWVETDDAAIAALAVEHFTERGFRHFGYCGDARFAWSNARRDHFARLAALTGGSVSVHDVAAPRGRLADWGAEQAALAAWVRSLPRPAGVMACYDIMAQRVLDACRDAGLAVPEEIAVLGVDDDELLCRLADPPLTSIVPDARRAGYTAAALLLRLMRGAPVTVEPTFLLPLGVAARQSTDAVAVSDPVIADALRFIREHVCDGIAVKDVLARAGRSRRVFERRFRAVVGRTPHDELVRARLAQAKVLLVETDLPIARIAERVGYEHIEYLSAQFRRVVGLSPRQYRNERRRGSGEVARANRR